MKACLLMWTKMMIFKDMWSCVTLDRHIIYFRWLRIKLLLKIFVNDDDDFESKIVLKKLFVSYGLHFHGFMFRICGAV